MKHVQLVIFLFIAVISYALIGCEKEKTDPDTNDSTLNDSTKNPEKPKTNLLTAEQVHNAIKSDMSFQFTDEIELTDGKIIKGNEICGTIFTGLYSQEEDSKQNNYKNLPYSDRVENGKGIIPVSEFFTDIEDKFAPSMKPYVWVSIRVYLYNSVTKKENLLGMYDTHCVVQKQRDGSFKKLPTIIKGPFVEFSTKDSDLRAIVTFKTDEPVSSGISLDWQDKSGNNQHSNLTSSGVVTEHKHVLNELEPDTTYSYSIEIDVEVRTDINYEFVNIDAEYVTKRYKFKTPKE